MPEMQIRTGAAPAALDAPAAGELLCVVPLPEDWRSSAGRVSWSAKLCVDGAPGHFRIVGEGGEALMQGSISLPGCGGDLTLDSVRFAPGRTLNINHFHFFA